MESKQEPQDRVSHCTKESDKTSSNRKLVAEVMVRYWKEKESKQQQQQTKKQTKTETIHPMDVLFGRRQAQRKHPGNVRLRELCHAFQREYRNGDRGHKTSITWRIVHMIQNEGGRFLKFDQEDWTEVDNDVAREKVAFTIRDTFHQLLPDHSPEL